MTEAEPASPQAADDGVGARLRAARLAAGLDLAEIAQRTRVNARHLAAIEAGDFSALPAAPYSVGFVKAYAREVGLDGAALSAEFRRERDSAVFAYGEAEAQRYEPSHPSRLPGRALSWTAAVIALLILVGYGAWRTGTLTGGGADDTARMAAATDQPAAAATPEPARAAPVPPPAPVGPPRVVLTATEPAWIKVYERDGDTLFQGELKQGQTYEVPAAAQDPLIRLGRAEAVSVTVGGKAVAPLGPPARTVKDVSLRAQALLERPAAA